MKSKIKSERARKRIRRAFRIRKSIEGTTERPRLTVFRSGKHMYAQIIDDIHGKTVRELMGEERYPEAYPHLQAALAGKKVRYEKTIEAPHKSRDAMVTYRPDIDASGMVVGVVIHASTLLLG